MDYYFDGDKSQCCLRCDHSEAGCWCNKCECKKCDWYTQTKPSGEKCELAKAFRTMTYVRKRSLELRKLKIIREVFNTNMFQLTSEGLTWIIKNKRDVKKIIKQLMSLESAPFFITVPILEKIDKINMTQAELNPQLAVSLERGDKEKGPIVKVIKQEGA